MPGLDPVVGFSAMLAGIVVALAGSVIGAAIFRAPGGSGSGRAGQAAGRRGWRRWGWGDDRGSETTRGSGTATATRDDVG